MNEHHTNVPPHFAPDTSFAVPPLPTAPFRAAQERELERLKHGLLREFLTETPDPEFNSLYRRAANEAAGLAWLTPYPLLVFPGLFEELARAARARGLRQERIRRRSQGLLALAA